MISTSRESRSENIRVLPVVIAELELGHIQRHVFAADLVEGAHHASLEDRPEALNRIRVNRADDVLALGVVDNAERIVFGEASVASPLISAKPWSRQLRSQSQ
jgi:hypothetical protein